jgi:hypothetical protein
VGRKVIIRYMCVYLCCMNKMNIQEGSINVKEKTNRIMEVIKKVLREMYDNKEIVGGKTIGEENFNKVLSVLNSGIGEGLKREDIDVGCPIYFVYRENSDADGWYNPKMNEIYMDGLEYLIDVYDDGISRYKRYFEIQFKDMSRTLEHELVHYEQGLRSGGKVFKRKSIHIPDEEYKELVKMFKVVKMDEAQRAKFIATLIYYNDEAELDTFANNAADMYVQYMLKQFGVKIKYYIKSTGEGSKREYSGDEVKRFVLSPIYNAKEGDNSNYYNLRFLKIKLKEYHKGYNYLTVNNRKKWWRYVIKSLLNHKFDSMVF